MSIFSIENFNSKLNKEDSILGIDLGIKNIGIAISDKTRSIAFLHSLYKRRSTRKDLGYINALYKKNNAKGIVIGMPFSHIRENTWINSIISVSNRLQKQYALNVLIRDEDNSTRVFDAFDKTNKKRDILSAYYILQNVINELKFY